MKTKDITITAMMAALVFAGTYFFKIPVPFGYCHLGDGMILLTVILFGWKKGLGAGMIGAGFSDLLGGYTAWVIPTMLIKGGWVLILAFFLGWLGKEKKAVWILGSTVGGIFHVAAYSFANIALYGVGASLSELPFLLIQTICGIITGILAAAALTRRTAHSPLP